MNKVGLRYLFLHKGEKAYFKNAVILEEMLSREGFHWGVDLRYRQVEQNKVIIQRVKEALAAAEKHNKEIVLAFEKIMFADDSE